MELKDKTYYTYDIIGDTEFFALIRKANEKDIENDEIWEDKDLLIKQLKDEGWKILEKNKNDQ